MYDSKIIANYILARAWEREGKHALTSMQLLKLVFLAHGWTLGLLGRPLIRDEVQAWQYGPVIPSLYEEIRKYRGLPVTEPLAIESEAVTIEAAERNVVDQIYEIYGTRSGPALSRLTHRPGSPWHRTYVPGSFGTVIPNDLIEDYYFRLASTRSERAA